MAKKQTKVPKKVAGIKVPRELRAKLQPVLKAAEHPVVADLIAAGIAAASAAIANTKMARDFARKAGDEAVDAADSTAKQARRTGDMVKSIAIDFARHFIDAYEGRPSTAGSARAKPKKTGRRKGQRSASKPR
jgi:hypothetical protein